jgi:hypothetical protein
MLQSSRNNKKVIKTVKDVIQNNLKTMDEQTIIRQCKVFPKHLLCALNLMITKHIGWQEALLNLKYDKLIGEPVTHYALNDKILRGHYSEYFRQLNHDLLNTFFNFDQRDRRILAVDGSKINVSKKLVNNGFKIIDHQRYCTALISTMFEVNQGVPYDCQLNTSLNERTISKSECREKDLFIFDRGYFSYDLSGKLMRLNKDFIFRLQKDLPMVKNLEQSGTNDYNTKLNGTPVRIIKYQITGSIPFKMVKNETGLKPFRTIPNLKNFYLITSLLNSSEYSIETRKSLYHQRWSIEEYYKCIKRNFQDKTLHSIRPESIECELCVQQLIIIITRIFNRMIKPIEGYKINQKISSDIISEEVLPQLICNKCSSYYLNNLILSTIERIAKCLIQERLGRHEIRETRFHTNKFRQKPPYITDATRAVPA